MIKTAYDNNKKELISTNPAMTYNGEKPGLSEEQKAARAEKIASG